MSKIDRNDCLPTLERLFTPWRDELNAVAGIIEKGGGYRVVSTPPRKMHHHVGPEERLFIVPGLWWWGDIPWHEIPRVIAQVGAHVFLMTNGQHGAAS